MRPSLSNSCLAFATEDWFGIVTIPHPAAENTQRVDDVEGLGAATDLYHCQRATFGRSYAPLFRPCSMLVLKVQEAARP